MSIFANRKEFDEVYQQSTKRASASKRVAEYLENVDNERHLKAPFTLHLNLKSLMIYSTSYGIRKDHTAIGIKLLNQTHRDIPATYLPLSKYVQRLELPSKYPVRKDVLRNYIVGDIITNETLTFSPAELTNEAILQAYLAGHPFQICIEILGYIAPYDESRHIPQYPTRNIQTPVRFAHCNMILSPQLITQNQAMISNCDLLADADTMTIISNRMQTFTLGKRQSSRLYDPGVVGKCNIICCCNLQSALP